MPFHVSILVLGLALFWEPGSYLAAQHVAPERFNIEEIWRTKGHDLPDGPFGAVTGMAVGQDSSIWISDPLQRRVVVLAPNGRGRGVIARSGEGPGEVRSPSLIARREDQMAVYDVGRGSVELFSVSSGSFVRRVQLRAYIVWPKGFVVVPGRGLVLSGGLAGSRFSIHQFDDSGQLLTSWVRSPDTRNWQAALVVAGGPLAVLKDGTLLFSRAAPHELIRYTRSAEGLYTPSGTVMARDPELLKPVGDDAIQTGWEGGVRVQTFRQYARSAGVFVLSTGRILNVVVFPDEGKTVFQLYDLGATTLLAQQEIQETIRPWDVTPADELVVSLIDRETGEWVVAGLRLF